ncbi:hypothetical protein [uncultured Clostridium sp.]|uniref:hypothetical protein n=1 Tax=uncultured Clostridium sp. TaxID=59620 RepID=UPI00262D9AB5|nr:hypothetical protein [uncultured Clostridium sp.]
MRQTIRNCTFETNSSSTHSLSILSEEDFKKFEEDGLYLDSQDNLLTREQLEEKLFTQYYSSYEEAKQDFFRYEGYEEGDFSEEELKEKIVDYALRYNGSYYNYYNMLGDGQEDYETFETHYTTKNGDKIVVFGYYGYEH